MVGWQVFLILLTFYYIFKVPIRIAFESEIPLWETIVVRRRNVCVCVCVCVCEVERENKETETETERVNGGGGRESGRGRCQRDSIR
jgi:hypothetical protein